MGYLNPATPRISRSINGTGLSYWALFRWERRRPSFQCSANHADGTVSGLMHVRNGARLMAMGNALTSIVVVNGQITGTWKRRVAKGTAVIRMELFD